MQFMLSTLAAIQLMKLSYIPGGNGRPMGGPPMRGGGGGGLRGPPGPIGSGIIPTGGRNIGIGGMRKLGAAAAADEGSCADVCELEDGMELAAAAPRLKKSAGGCGSAA